MTQNPYQPPLVPSDPPRARRQQRPKGPYGYMMAVLIGVLLGGVGADSIGLWDYSALAMLVVGGLALGLYHFLPHYEQRDE